MATPDFETYCQQLFDHKTAFGKPEALKGYRVLSCTQYILGPSCAAYLAELGAEVIKIETPISGDESRQHGPFPGDVPHAERSGLFLYLNANKLGITLNPSRATGKKILGYPLISAYFNLYRVFQSVAFIYEMCSNFSCDIMDSLCCHWGRGCVIAAPPPFFYSLRVNTPRLAASGLCGKLGA